jgi:serine/threonine-protein kinase
MGNSAQQIIMKIIGDTPRPVTQLRKSVPPHVAAAVAKALEKLPADRFDSAKAFAEALERPGTFTATATTATPGLAPSDPRSARLRPLITAGALLVAAIAGGAARAFFGPKPESPATQVSQFRLQLPEDAAPTGALGSTIAFSPDGTRWVYVGAGRGRFQLFTRGMSQIDPVPIPGTEDGSLPFFSPDGEWLGFRQGTRLMKVQISGGPVLSIATIPGSVFGASWMAGDTIAFAVDSGIMEVPVSGGTARMLARPDSSRREQFRWPDVLPGSRAILFSVFSDGSSKLAALDRRTGEVKRLAQPGGYPRYVDPGFLMISGLSGSIAAVRFDPSRLEVSGSVIAFAEANAGNDGDVNLAVSRTGQVVYQPSGAVVTQRLVLADRSGALRDLGAPPAQYLTPRLSPDGKRVAIGTQNDNFTALDIWVYDIARRVRTRLTTDTISANPVWTLDGRRIVFGRSNIALIAQGRGLDEAQLHTVNADGGTAPRLLFGARGFWIPSALLPDGRGLVASGATSSDSSESIWLFEGDSSAAPVNLVPGKGAKTRPSLSPDGRFFAYQSNESGRTEVYVRSLSVADTRRQVSSQGGGQPRWSPTGAEIFFRSGDNGRRMMAAEVRTKPSLEVGATRELFDGPPGPYDVMPDGRSFLMLEPIATQDAAFVVVLNWFDELRRQKSGGRP